MTRSHRRSRTASAFYAVAVGVGAFVAMGVLQLATASRSDALAPDEYGWWTESNPDDVTGLVTGAPTIPPDVPPGGMLVEGPGASPTAIAALAFTTDSGPRRRERRWS